MSRAIDWLWLNTSALEVEERKVIADRRRYLVPGGGKNLKLIASDRWPKPIFLQVKWGGGVSGSAEHAIARWGGIASLRS